MTNQKIFALFVGICLIFSSQLYAEVAMQTLSLKALIQLGIENNFEIKIAKNDTEIKKTEYLAEQGDFDTQLSASVYQDQTNTPASSSLDGAGNTRSVISESSSQTVSVEKKFKNGLSLKLPYSHSLNDSNSSTKIIKKSYSSSLAANINWSVIKGLYGDYYQRKLIDKEYQFQITKFTNIEKFEDIILDIISNYFDLSLAYYDVDIKKAGVSNSSENLSFVKNKLSLGKASRIELLESETQLRNSEELLYKSQKKFMDKKDELINLVLAKRATDFQVEFPQEILGENLIKKIKKKIQNPEKWDISGTLYEKNKMELEKSKFAYNFSKIDVFPTLDFDGEFKSSALNKSWSEVHSDLSKLKYKSWNIGFSSKYTLFSYASKSNVKIKELLNEQAKIKFDMEKTDHFYQLRSLVRSLQIGFKSIDAFEESVKAEEERYLALKTKSQYGFINIFDLNNGLNSLMNSKQSLLRSKIDLIKNFYSFERLIGNLKQQLQIIIK